MDDDRLTPEAQAAIDNAGKPVIEPFNALNGWQIPPERDPAHEARFTPIEFGSADYRRGWNDAMAYIASVMTRL